METRHGNLDIEEDLPFQQRTWKVERVGWILMALIALASVLGLIDKGPLSQNRKGDPSTLEVQYNRFIHLETPAQLRVRLPSQGSFSLQLEPVIRAVVIYAGVFLFVRFSGRRTLARVDESDILEAARRLRGLENMSQIKYAVLEKSGGITIIPYTEIDRPQNQPTASSA